MVSGGGGIPSNRERVNLILSFSHKGTDERKDARVEKTKEGKSAVNLYASRQRSKSAKSQIHHTLTLSHSHALTLSRSWARSTFSIQCIVGKKNTSRYRSTQQGRWVVYRAQFSLQLHLPPEDLTYYCDSLKHSRPENKFSSINITLLALSMSYFWWKSSIMKRATGLWLHSSKFRLWIFNLWYLCGHLYSAEGKGENTVLPWSGTMCIFSMLINR